MRECVVCGCKHMSEEFDTLAAEKAEAVRLLWIARAQLGVTSSKLSECRDVEAKLDAFLAKQETSE